MVNSTRLKVRTARCSTVGLAKELGSVPHKLTAAKIANRRPVFARDVLPRQFKSTPFRCISTADLLPAQSRLELSRTKSGLPISYKAFSLLAARSDSAREVEPYA